ncbi:uncharacterized protein LOC133744483 [Rosa rugosa]|uniref:uncharacterized protein LOC133744483 n=1 Tax=Rosa rugosa TaxID=74645 RepID=UPI002B41747E|nr:uncharacterized protein LOC133744483 [Rosa rugosa]
MATQLAAALALTDDAVVEFGEAGAAAVAASGFYLVGRMLAPRAEDAAGLPKAMATVWGLRDRLSITKIEGDRFQFRFAVKEEGQRVLHGGPWHFKNRMLLLEEYDGFGAPELVPLNSLEAWVTVRRLPPRLQTEESLILIGSSMGRFLRAEKFALQQGSPEQRFRVLLDVRRRLWGQQTFGFTETVRAEVDMFYEKVKGWCRECGLFDHGDRVCDKFLIKKSGGGLTGPTGLVLGGQVTPAAARKESAKVILPETPRCSAGVPVTPTPILLGPMATTGVPNLMDIVGRSMEMLKGIPS